MSVQLILPLTTKQEVAAKLFSKNGLAFVSDALSVVESNDCEQWYVATFAFPPPGNYIVNYYIEGEPAGYEICTFREDGETVFPWSVKQPGANTGPRAIHIVVTDVGDGVAGIRFGIVGTAITGYSDSQGRLSLFVDGSDEDPQTYTLRTVTPNWYADVAEREVVVGSDDVTEAIELVRLSAVVTPPPGACAVTVQVVDQSGQPIEGVAVSAKLSDGYAVADDSMAINAAEPQTTDENGMVTLILIRDQAYNLTAVRNDCSVTIKIRTPDAEAATLGQVVIG